MVGSLYSTNPWMQFGSQALSDLGYGLTRGKNLNEGFQQATQRTAEMQPLRDAETLRQEQIQQANEEKSATIEWLAQNHPDLAGMVQNGMPVGEAWQTALKRMEPNGGDSASFGLTPIWGIGPDGQPAIAQLSNQGGVQPVEMPEGFQFGKDPIRMDAGTHFVLLDPVTRQQIGTIPKEVRQEAAEQAAGTVEGRTGAERAIEAPMVQANLARLDAQTQNVIDTIDKATGQIGWGETGLLGQVAGAVAGTRAFDLRETVKTIKANLGFAELQAMRDASPTGGALGQVAVQELEALQSTLASLNPDQSEETLRTNLAKVKQLLERQKEFRRIAAEAKFGGAAPVQPAVPTGDVDAILGGYGL